MKMVGIKIPYKLVSPATKEDAEEVDLVVVLLDEKRRDTLLKYITNSPKTRYDGVVDSDSRSAVGSIWNVLVRNGKAVGGKYKDSARLGRKRKDYNSPQITTT